MNPTIKTAIRDSVQVQPNPDSGISTVIDLDSLRTPVLPPWGTRRRERMLRWWYRHPYSWMIQGAFAGLINKWLATPHKVEGAKRGINSVYYFDDILRNAEFGESWDALWSKVWLDFLRQDGGAYIEVIAPGDPTKPISQRISGLAHLDSLRCYPTGNAEFPVIYYNRDGSKHKLHADRVIHLVDMPDGDEFNPGYGLCALSRVIAHVQLMFYQSRYNVQQMDELPPPGFALLYGLSEETFLKKVDEFTERKNRDLPPVYGNLVLLQSLIKKGEGVGLEIVGFSNPPEKYDYPAWVNMLYDAVALGIGVDRQELAQLTGAGIGSGAQSQVLHLKSQGKMYGHMLSLAERSINDVLPESAELIFEPDDAYENQEAAAAAQAWTAVVQAASADTTPDERRQMLANVVPQWKDVLTNDAGELVKLPDSDVKPEGDTEVGDANPAPSASEQGTGGDATADGQNQQTTKDIASTRAAFERDFADLLTSARKEETNRRRFGIILRDIIRKYGDRAFRDGLEDGGVADAELDAEDKAVFMLELAKQSGFVTALGDAVYKDGISDGEAALKASMWYGGSIKPFYDAGVGSADRNGYYQFHLGAAEMHCKDCPRLDGQIHRFTDWHRRNLIPGRPGQATACGGWMCKCYISKAEPGARAQGGY